MVYRLNPSEQHSLFTRHYVSDSVNTDNTSKTNKKKLGLNVFYSRLQTLFSFFFRKNAV